MFGWIGRRGSIPERYRLVGAAMALAAVALSAVLGLHTSPQLATIVALSLGGVPVFVLLLRAPEWGLVALVFGSLLVPWELGTGTNVPLNAPFLLAPLLVALWVVRMLVVEKDVRLVPSRANVPALLFILATTLALITGAVRWIPAVEGASLSAQLGGWGLYVFSIALFLLVANQVRDVRCLRALTWLFLALGAAHVVVRYAHALVFSLDSLMGLFAGSSDDSSFWTWLVALAFGQCWLNRDLKLCWRLLLGALIIAALGLGLSEASRAWLSGWLPPLIAIYAIVWLRSWRWGLAVTVVACLIVIALLPTISSEILSTPEQTYSTDVRLAMWALMPQMIQKSPFLGLGLGNYHFYTHLYPVWGYSINFNTHNNYIDILAQVGLVGFAFFAWLAVEIGRLGWRLRRWRLDGFGRAYVCAALGGWVATLVSGMAGDWFLPFVYNVGVAGFRSSLLSWLFLGGLVAIGHIARSQQGPADE